MAIILSAEPADCPFKASSVLLEPEFSDVQISVVDKHKESKVFHAHKLVLAVASDVFKTMFLGSVPQGNPVIIKDSNPAAFEAFLRFVYTGTATITEADVFALLYLGKKYMVRSLNKVVMNHLEGCITAENVGQLVLTGQDFLEDAPPKFWESLESHGEALLKSEELLQLRKDTVKALVQRELQVEETFIYDKAVAWAAADCTRNQLPVNGETLRSALEGVVEHIRFPTMTATDFARGPAAEAVLTAEEKVHVFSWFAADIPQTIFPDTPRYVGEGYVCERLQMCSWWSISGTTEAIDFSVSRAVCVTGVGVYGFYDDGLDRSSIIAKMSLGSVVLAEKELTGISDYSEIVSINFDKPVKTKANERYTASIVVSGPKSFYGYEGTASKTVSTKKGDVVFSFMQSASSTDTTVDQGQIPQILFRI